MSTAATNVAAGGWVDACATDDIEEEDVIRRTEAALTGAADLNVPLTVSMATGPSWAAAKG